MLNFINFTASVVDPVNPDPSTAVPEPELYQSRSEPILTSATTVDPTLSPMLKIIVLP